MKKFAFAGLQHGHVATIYKKLAEHPDCEIAGVYDSVYDENFNIKVTHKNLQSMIAEVKPDVLVIGDAYGKRGQLVIEGLKANLNIISDKPLCTSLAELDEIEKLVREKNAVVGCMLDLRENNNVYAAKKYIEQGIAGKIKSIHFDGQHPLCYGTRPAWYFEKGMHGGTVNDIAIHALDICEFLLNDEIKSLDFAESWNTFTEVPHFQDGSRLAFTMKNGCRCMGEVSYFAPDANGYDNPWYWRFTIWGEKGVMEFNFCSSGITFASKNQTGLQHLDGMDNEWTDLTSFLAELDGKSAPLNTKQVLKISRKSLELQQKSLK